MDLTGYNLEELPGAFACDVIVQHSAIVKMAEQGTPLDGFIDNAAGNGTDKWSKVGAHKVLLQGSGPTTDRLLEMGWRVDVVRGRPIMPDNSGKGRRVAHTPGFEASWVLAVPPA